MTSEGIGKKERPKTVRLHGGTRVTKPQGRIIHGDCIKELSKLDAGSVDLAFADPPFNIGYDYDEYHDKRSCEDYVGWSREWISGVIRVLKPNGTFWLAIGDEYAAELKVLATRELGLTCRSWVIWYYTFGVHCKYKFARSHAHLFYFVKDEKNFTFHTDDIRVPSARQLVYGDKRANPKGRMPDDTWIIAPANPRTKGQRDEGTKGPRDQERNNGDGANDNDPYRDRKGAARAPRPVAQHGVGGGSSIDNPLQAGLPESTIDGGWILRPQDLPDGFTPDGDTWYFPRVCGTFKQRQGFHGCQMPEQLLGRIIKACSNKGDLVLDPFAGSGTTPAAAKKLSRRYLGIELSKQYVTESASRLSRIKPGDPLDGVEDPLTSVVNTANGVIRTPDGKRIKRNDSARGFARSKHSEMDDIAPAVIEAFRAVHRGYSTDWLLADKELNAEFVENCRRLSISGGPRDWNARLLTLRKTKKLGRVSVQRAPRLDGKKLRECEFASEISLSELREALNMTLDRILCDPQLAERFDVLADEISPGFPSVYYRWAALGLRKEAAHARKYALRFSSELENVSLVRPQSVGDLSPDDIPEHAGVYLLLSPDSSMRQRTALYVGETQCLRTWVRATTETGTFDAVPFRGAGGKRILYRHARRRVDDHPERRGLQAHLTGKYHAIWNYQELDVTAA
jgi:site-specific DNA-methyltransferase (adenine-specific)